MEGRQMTFEVETLSPVCSLPRKSSRPDRRFLRTEKYIKSAFISLLAEKSIVELSVKDIIDRAGISRSAFYKHYADKMDLLAAFEERIKTDLQQKPYPKFMQSREDYVRKKIIYRYQYFDEHIEMMRALFGPNGDAAFQKRMHDFLWDEVHIEDDEITLLERKENIPGEYLNLINRSASFFFDVWIHKENRESPEDVANIIVRATCIAQYKII